MVACLQSDFALHLQLQRTANIRCQTSKLGRKVCSCSSLCYKKVFPTMVRATGMVDGVGTHTFTKYVCAHPYTMLVNAH